MAAARASYAEHEGTWIIVLEGDVRHALAPALNALLDRAFAAPDTHHFVVDLSQAVTVDSTCLGVIARLAGWSTQRDVAQPVIVAPGPDIRTTLHAICLDRLFDVRSEPVPLPADRSDIAAPPADERVLSDTVLDAHRRLCAVDKANEETFGGVVEALQRERDGQ